MEKEFILKSVFIVIALLLVFEFGFLASNIFLDTSSKTEQPSGTLHYNSEDIPADRISEGNIEVYKDRVVIWIENASLSDYAATKSMIPVLDQGANGIRIVPQSEDEINVGDIVTYDSGNGLIVHRVIETGYDEQGKYFVTKGDNNFVSDGKVRFEQIKYLTVAVLY